jgi:hypothetical protein
MFVDSPVERGPGHSQFLGYLRYVAAVLLDQLHQVPGSTRENRPPEEKRKQRPYSIFHKRKGIGNG